MSALVKAVDKIVSGSSVRELTQLYELLPARIRKQVPAAEFGDVLIHELLTSGNTNIAVVPQQQLLVKREELFADCSFRVQLTEEERVAHQLIIGHRLLPYIHPSLPVEQLIFLNTEGERLKVFFEQLPINPQTGIYFSLLPPYGIAQYLKQSRTEEGLYMAVLDLEPVFALQPLGPEDQLLITARDYQANEFHVEVLSSREISARRLADRYRDQQLTDAIYEMFGIIGQAFLPVDMHLFWSMASLGPELATQPATPFGPFISRHDTLTFYQEGPYSFLQDKHYLDDMMERALQNSMQPSLEEMGKAKDFDGIMRELGNSFSEILTRAIIAQKMIESQEIDKEEIMEHIFAARAAPFFNRQQEQNFEQAFKKLLKEVKRQWQSRQLALPYLQLLRKAIRFKLDIVHLLRDLNEYIHDPQQLNMEALLQLQPIDHSLDQILNNLLSDSPMAHQEAQSLTKQLDKGREKFLQFREEFLEDL